MVTTRKNVAYQKTKCENCSSQMIPVGVCDSPTTAQSRTTYRLRKEGLEWVQSILKLHALCPGGGILKTGHGELRARVTTLQITDVL